MESKQIARDEKFVISDWLNEKLIQYCQEKIQATNIVDINPS